MTNPGHVGLYLGSGLLVQAPHTGDVVKISPAWGASQIAAIRRIVPS
jgi:cell wall-associated NlpC family hydrolase